MVKAPNPAILTALRPRQWLKNLVVFAAIVFSQEVFLVDKFLPVVIVFVIFCAASSSMYLVNDVVDREADQLHFAKKYRPIAAGQISVKTALVVALVLALFSLAAAAYLSKYLFFIVIFYLIIQNLYTLVLKQIIILDVLTISIAFMLRIFAGSLVVETPLSSWLILTTMMLALFLSIGKRRSELTLLNTQDSGRYRKTLLFYPQALLDGLVFMMATATLITYSLFTFNSPEVQEKQFLSTLLPTTLSSPKLLMVTIPIVVYGIFRYLYLIFEKSEGDSPEKVLLSDKPLLASIIVWLFLILFILYLLAV